jgi:hypothetical protein
VSSPKLKYSKVPSSGVLTRICRSQPMTSASLQNSACLPASQNVVQNQGEGGLSKAHSVLFKGRQTCVALDKHWYK